MDNSKTTKPPNSEEAEQTQSAASGRGSPYARLFSPNANVWREARTLATNRNSRVEDLALTCSQDPVLVIELLKTANAMYFSGGRAPITIPTTAIIRLGSDVVLETLEALNERPKIEEAEVHKLFELHRNRCKRAAIIARMLAEIISKTMADDCHTGGLLLFVGEMLAVAHYGMAYVKLFESHSLATVNYRLAQDNRFDVEKMGVGYLQRQGIPESILFALDREGKTRSQERAVMKPVCFAAAEVIDAFDMNRWEKLAPGKQLPPKSSLRFLGLGETQYLRLYERASEYLFAEKAGLNKPVEVARPDEPPITLTSAPTTPLPLTPEEKANADLEAEIQSLLSDSTEDEEDEIDDDDGEVKSSERLAPPPLPSGAARLTPPSAEAFSLKSSQPKTKARKEDVKSIVAPPPLRTAAGNSFVENVSKQLNEAKSSEELLRGILGILTEQGPFQKSALIVVAKDRNSALVVAARGPDISTGQTLILEDPLSPLAQCFSKVQSFGNRSSKESPWGSKAFALAPIDADHETPVALYADCGTMGSLSFEARRMFRAVVDILNQKLPTIPGGIPVELQTPE